MLGVPISLDDVSIVLKGSFNPAIFSPAWLLAQGIIGPSEHDQADVEVITRDIATFTCAWMKVLASKDTFQLSTSVEAEFERLRDAAVAVLTALPHTPISVLGINRNVHFRVESIEALHRVGDALAPKTVWEGVLDMPGMRSMTIWGVRPGTQEGRIQVTVEPSNAIPQSVFVGHNDHYALVARNELPSKREEAWTIDDADQMEATSLKLAVAIETLMTDWKASMQRAEAVIQRVSEQAS